MDSCGEYEDMPEFMQIQWISTVNTHHTHIKSKARVETGVRLLQETDLDSWVERRDPRELMLPWWSYTCSHATRVCTGQHNSYGISFARWMFLTGNVKFMEGKQISVSSWSSRKYEWIFLKRKKNSSCFHHSTQLKTLLWLCCSPCWEKGVAVSTAFHTTVSYICVILWTCN